MRSRVAGVSLAILFLAACRSRETADAAATRELRATSFVEAALSALARAPTCPVDAWPTYGHDARRTSASPGCARPGLVVLWTFAPDTKGRESQVLHPVADETGVYVSVQKGNSPAVYRLDENGAPRWHYDSRADIDRGQWLTLAIGSVVMNDDGLYVLDPDTGKLRFDRGLDTWGQTLGDDTHLFMTNTWHVEGPGVFVGALDREARSLWKQNKFGSVKEDVMDDGGGLAEEGGVLVQAANYRFAPHSGIFAFDRDSGEQRWKKSTWPVGDPAITKGLVITPEKDGRGKPTRLTARRLDDGEEVWRAEIPGLSEPSPVVAGELVIAHGDEGTVASDRATGARAWTTPDHDKPARTMEATSMAAAMGSRSIAVTSPGRLRLLSLDDGRELDAVRVGDKAAEVHSPIVVGERVYCVAGGALVALGPGPTSNR